MDDLREELLDVLAPVTPRAGEVPVYSTVTGRVEDGSAMGAEYWFDNLRNPVEFADAVEQLRADGFGTFVECSPHPVLTMALPDDVVAVGSLRRDEGGLDRLLLSLGEAVVAGVEPDWNAVVPGGHRVDLPTYPFQHERFWPRRVTAPAGSPAGFGQGAAGHPFLGALVSLADGDGAVLTGRISLDEHPWLADHVVAGRLVVPGTALVELALCAGDHTAAPHIEELTLQRPLILPEQGALSLQVSVGPDHDGRRSVAVHSRPDADDAPWTRHADGRLTTVAPETPAHDGVPPEVAEEIAVDGLYAQLASHDLGYGPAFQGLRRAWRDGDDVLAEVRLDDTDHVTAERFGLHPAVLDAALHAIALGEFVTEATRGGLPFSFTDVRLSATGATALRVRISAAGPDTVTVTATDPEGTPVVRIGGLAVRPLDAAALAPATGAALYAVDHTPVDHRTFDTGVLAETPDATGAPRILDVDDQPTAEILAAVQDHLADEGSGLLVVRTRSTVAGAAARGLVRTAANENPGRLALIDTDGTLDAVVVADDEPELVVRGGRVLAPRLVRAEAAPVVEPFGGGSRVLVTGGTGRLGAVVARHLVVAHGVGEVVLAGRRGGDAPGVEALVGELSALGASARVVACDVADRGAVAALLAEFPVTAVVHAAGTLDDGLVTDLDADRLNALSAPKLDAARNLAELAGDLDAFVLFSSAAGVFGNPGQAGYAAANTALDAFAVELRAQGVPATSLPWGLWAGASDMTGHLDETQLRRTARGGVRALTDADALALLSAAVRTDAPVLLPLDLDLAAVRAAGEVPPLLRSLVPAPRKKAATPDTPTSELGPAAAVELVRATTAAVLGHDGASAVDPERAFADLGFDSLTAVELRNRLATATGLRLPATLVFDHPTPQALAAHIAGDAPARRTGTVTRPVDEPIAIVSMGCRYPGGIASPDDLWDLVAGNRDAVGPFPADRGWDLAALTGGRPDIHAGGFLAEAADFDAGLFGISPREALAMDPQQRQLLEVSWETFERAGMDPHGLRGSRTGVFAGVMYQDYASRLGSVPDGVEGHLGTGNSASVVSGRVSYTFGLEGPAVTVDTACSSSLVAVHLAAQALRTGECDLGLAGGVTIMSTPGVFVEFTRQQGLSADGRCRSFADGADGTGFSEGVGLVLLERLSDARRNGHPVLALLRGSAVNQDGASNGLTAPNGPSQERVITTALESARLRPADVDLVEAHGTGTVLGDPIEAQALMATYGRDRHVPLQLGSVKSNLGHTQAAAGVAGIIKSVQAMRHGVVPASLHVDAPSTRIDWSGGAVELLTANRDWPAVDRPRRAGVSSFGISGTNAHVVLEQAGADPDASAPSPQPDDGPHAWVLSAHDETALAQQARRLAAHLTDEPAADVARTLAATRARLPQRAVVVGDRDRLLHGLAAFDGPGVVRGTAARGRTAFVFTGQGAQHAGMGRELAAAYPVFARTWEAVLALFPEHVRDELTGGGERIGETEFAQPALLAFEVALAGLLESWGVTPDVVIGHSVGEIAAAHVAGILTLEDAAELVVRRGALMASVRDRGAMAAIDSPAADVDLPEGVEIAAVNGPRSTVVSGDEDAVLAVLAAAKERGVRATRLDVSHAFHSAHMDEVLPEFRAFLDTVTLSAPVVEFVGVAGDSEARNPESVEYWVANIRETVRFADGVSRLDAAHVLEVGPDAALAPLVEGCVPAQRTDRDERTGLLEGLATLHVGGRDVDWARLTPHARLVDLPTYAFQHTRYWLDAEPVPVEPWLHRVEWDTITLGEPTTEPVAVLGEAPCDHRRIDSLDELADETLLLVDPDPALITEAVGRATRTWVVSSDAAVLAVARVAALEHPDRVGGTITVTDPAGWADVPRVLAGTEDQVRLGGRAAARRIVPATPTRSWRPRGTVLITGGSGALGTEAARWVAAEGADEVVLVSRSGADDAVLADLRATAGTTRIVSVAADVTDRDAMTAVVADHAPDAVVHTAGVSHVAPLTGTIPEDYARVAAAKVAGARILHDVTADLDAFVVYSSIAGVWGSGEQAAYAAANAALEDLVAERRAAGLPATAIAWGPWAGDGMAGGDTGADLTRRGLRPMEPRRAVEALSRTGEPLLVVADVDWARFTDTFTATRPSPLLARVTPETGDAATADDSALRTELAGLADAEVRRRLTDLVRTSAAAVLGHASTEPVPVATAFRDLGFDSLTAVELRDRIAAATGLTLPATLVFDHPSCGELAEHLRVTLLGGAERGRVRRAEAADEPIAVVGMACRFPGGADSPEALWQLLADGRDAVRPFPEDRGWDTSALFDADPDHHGTSYATEGGFLDGVADFDAAFFGISPREALSADPQQRLLLETSWEALERAGIDAHTLRGSATGVFVGTNSQDYATLLGHSTEAVEGYVATGNAASVISGRISYAFGLEGPAATVDTACSSSLVALHWAAQALRSGECDLALAGGATVMSTPGAFVEFSRQRGLAADGRCKPFAAAADGTGWGEGVGVLLVERLSDARANGHPVLAVVRGSAVNQDGASNGLTAPNGPAQQRVIGQALATAGLEPSDVDVVEAHGTGTALGDPIEAQAVLATYGRDRSNPLLLGSVKSNLGHTQAAAGVAGVIKTIEALRRAEVPASLHVDEPSTHVDWTVGAVELATRHTPWPETGRPRRAAVSSFGISGTNAHVVLEQGEPTPAPEVTREIPFVLSARSEAALRARAADLADVLRTAPGLARTRIAQALATTRTHFEHRATWPLDVDADVLAEGPLVTGDATTAGRLAFLFPGQGSQRPGSGAQLYAADPVFAAAFDEACAHLDEHLDRPLREVAHTGDAELLGETAWTQPVLFAQQVALHRLAEFHGVVPDLLLGHSIGEVAAAHVAGVLDLADAAALVAARASLMQSVTTPGAMASVAAGEDEVRAVLPEGADIAAVNGPHATVVSGDCEAVAAVVEYFTTAGTKVRELRVSHAFHSAHLDPVLDRFRDVLTGLTFHEPRIPVVSDVTGAVATELTDPEYWVRQAREAVRFHDGLVCLREAGVTAALELGADGGLSSLAAAELSAAVPLLRDGQPGRGEPDAVTAALAALYVAGFDVDWTVLGPAPRDVVLPTYPFQRERFWPRSFAAGTGDAGAAGLGSAGHPLLGASVPVAGSDLRVFTARLSTRTHPWLADHRIGGDVLLPGTAYVDLAAHVGDEVGCPHVAEVTLAAPLVLPADGAAVDLQVNAGAPDERGTRTLAVHSRPAGDPDAAWTAHAEGVLSPELPGVPAPAGEWPPPGAEPVDLDGFYARLADAGFDYGPVFRALRGAWRSDGAVHAEVSLLSGPDGRGADAAQHRAGTDAAEHGLHPALLDAALQAAALDGGDGGVPFAFTGVALHATGADALRVTLRRSPTGAVSLRADDPAGAPVVTVDGLALRAPVAAETPTDAALLHLTWTPAAASDTDPAGTARPGAALRWAVLGTPPAAEVPPAVVADDLDDLAAAGSEGVLDYVVAPVTGHVDAHAATHAALDLVQRWLADDRFADARLVVLTVGASLDAPDVGHLPGTAVHGLVRSAQSENPDRLVLLDLDRADAELPAAALHLAATEPQLAVRDGVPHAARLVRAPEAPPAGGTWRLAAGADRTVDAVRALPGTADRALAEDEVRLAMRAAGVNFRDVLIALGMYPGDVPMGSEGAGVVLETGPGVTTLRPGQRVFGLVPEAFGPTAIADARMLAEVPDDWSFEDAAAVPLVFLTAYYALRDLADLREGESVLIHSAAGGVGMAAVQLARHWGAEVYGTASPSKWDAVRELGVDHLDSSRDLGFADRFGPVDVVLNSLAGEFIDASLGLLADGGRFLEMGKTDLRDPDGVHYRSFDLIEAGPERIGEMLTELVGLFAEGALRHLPRRHWDVREAAAAFRFVSQARHVGKVVLTVPRPRDPEGTVLVTGATGALGARVVRHLGEGGARHLLLASRSGPASPRAAELADLGAHVVACDLADRDDVAALLASIPDEHPLTAVVHVAGVLDDGVVGALNPDRVDRVFAPKVEAVTILHELTSHADLAEFTVFSSAAGVFGGAGQANYAAANAYLDALARHRRGLGLPATALAWGLWDESESMAAELGSADRGRLSRAGVGALSTTDALRLLDAAVEAPTSAVVPMHLDLAALRSAPEAAPRLLRDLVGPARTSRRRAGRAGDTAAPGAAQGLAERLAGRPADEADRTLLDLVRTHVAGVLGHGSPEAVDPRRAFKDIGFDSLTAVELRNRLTGETGLRLSATLIFDHPTPQELVEHLRGELLGSADAAPAVPARSDTDEPLAIVGLACRFPGGADTPEQLWAMLAEGRDGIGPFPVDRGWQMDALYDPTLQRPGTTHVREGGFIHGAGEFDAAFFGISPREALAMDPQQRLLLQTTWEALERAGIDPQALRGTDAGVFVGAATANYGAGLPALPDGVEGHLLTGTATSVASGRVSYTLGLEGPAVTVDTACSSSLVSLHLAAAALRSGECSLALAGGATVMAVPGAFTEFSRQGGLAPDGRCKPFAESADGTGWSEGVGMLVVERLSEAERRGHRVLAVLRGSAVNQDGASNGLTAPNGPSQQRVIRSALTTAGLRPSDVDAVEAHGTGTPLGDPIEAQALLATYGHERDRPLLLGSVKSNLGHTQAAAGVAGVIKMVMALRHRMIPQTLHVDRPSTRVDWAEGDMRLVTEPVDLSAEDRTLRAAVSSFGISGTNAHVVLEEGPAPAAAAPDHEPAASTVPWVLSARTTPVLRDQAARLLASVGDAQAADVAWSLSTTRASFDRRAALVGDRDTLVDGLRALATGGTHPSLVEGSAGEPGRLVLVFPGQGSQWVGMARDLAAESAVFAGRLAECEAALDGFVEWSLSDVLADVELLERVDVVQPALWAVMVSLAEVWRSWGVEPAAVVGHSQG
ncbi:SDR family NAD(P)-dependent oxidoreductase, partial [Prauserella aidingensis]|uniref:SDR family NAD(P)-dependent oxidoreductase n=1 Tax=Prauserella aidingensis TaxID=387890 RepID=UPI0027E298BE